MIPTTYTISHLFPSGLYLWSDPVLEILWKSECQNVFCVFDDKYFQPQQIRSLRAAFRKTDDWISVWNVDDLFVNQSWFYFYHPYLFRTHPGYNLHIRSYPSINKITSPRPSLHCHRYFSLRQTARIPMAAWAWT